MLAPAHIALPRRRLLLGAGAALVGACTTGGQAATPPADAVRTAGPRAVIDPTFAMLAIEERHRPSARRALRAHAALAALVRHRELSSGQQVDADELLDEVLANAGDAAGTTRVLAFWRGQDERLQELVRAAQRYLPDGAVGPGALFFVVGYDIGVAAPPNVAINVAHRHFVADPAEVGYYATHEAHHVGFMAERGLPPLADLERADRLRALVRYMTQLEGMAVHAAYPARARAGALEVDGDYQVYLDRAEAQRVVQAYGALRAAIPETGVVAPAVVGDILTALSSGERLAYRFGALVAAAIERERGRAALADTVRAPDRFDAVARRLARTA